MAGVGTRRVFEDDRVIVWQIDLEPGEQGELHTHELDYVVRVISGATVEVSGPDGVPLYTVNLEPGDAVKFKVDGDLVVSDRPGSRAIPATHSARNVSNSVFSEVLIEFKN